MAIAFTYDESTNTVVVTGGTAETPATFADFVTADRAGTAELTPEDAPVAFTQASSISLTYAVRPVEDLALTLTFTISGSAGLGAGDTIDLSGDDWEGNNQTESIVIAGGDAAYPSTKKYSTIDANGITFTDNAGGGFSGDLKVTQPQWGVIWDYGNSCQFQIDCHFTVGDGGGTSTYFQTSAQMIYFTSGFNLITTSNATFHQGVLVGDYGQDGSVISIGPSADVYMVVNGSTGIYKSYGSMLQIRVGNRRIKFSGTVDWRNIHFGFTVAPGFGYISVEGTNTLAGIYMSHIGNFKTTVALSPSLYLHVHNSTFGMYSTSPATVEGYNCSTFSQADAQVWSNTLSLKDPAIHITGPMISAAGGVITEQYTCNITVADKDGTLLDDVVVDCEDDDGTAVWTAGSEVTGATDTGKIDEQTITYKSWTGTSETLTTYSPHKITLSKAGYETLVLDNITVDGPIDWHLELLPALAEADVASGISFGENKTGTYAGKKYIFVIED